MELDFSKRDKLIHAYIDICNEALRRNRNRFPFKQILGAVQKLGNKTDVNLQVGEDGSCLCYKLMIGPERIELCSYGDGECKCERVWKVDEGYLELVIGYPKAFIENPAKLNWDWMYPAQEDSTDLGACRSLQGNSEEQAAQEYSTS